MRSILDAFSLAPTDEKILTQHPEFSRVTEGMELKPRLQQEQETNEFAVFRDKAHLEGAVDHLVRDGFLHSEIYIFVSHEGSLLDHRGGLKESKMGEGLVLGILTGITAGAIFGWLTGYGFNTPFRSLEIPRFFSLLLFAVIWGFIGGNLGALIGRSIPQYRESQYETNLPDGAILMILKVVEPARARLAHMVLRAHGAELVAPERIRKAG